VDVFSCGVLLYILLSGRTPFPGSVAKDVLNKNKECKIHFRKKYWKNISHQGLDLVLKLTDPNPKTRITAEGALTHEWFQMSHEIEVLQTFEVPENPIIPPLTPGGPALSHALMQRLKDSKDHQHLT
jgi:serine/threonine protein kinase